MVGISDAIGALLIVAVLVVVLRRIFQVRLDRKIRKKVDMLLSVLCRNSILGGLRSIE